MVLFAYGSAALCISTTPNKGNRARGTKAVTATGTASVAHQVPIKRKMAAVLCASKDKPSGVGKLNMMRAKIKPNTNPLFSLKKFT